MAWFIYSVILPSIALAVALAGCVIYWWIKERKRNGVAKRSASFNEEGSAASSTPASASSNFR